MVNASQSATYTITVAAQGGSFPGGVTLSCSGLPLLSSCSFNPPSVSPVSALANSTLTLSTTVCSALPPLAFRRLGRRRFQLLWPAWVALALVAAGFALRAARQRRWAAYLPLAFLLLVLVFQMVGCGGGSSGGPPPPNGTPAGTYTVTVTGTSGTTQHSTTITLNVN